MIFKPYYRYESGCASYLFGCGGLGLCAVADPIEPFFDKYIAFAEAKEMRVTHVLETHVHADHRSVGPEPWFVLTGDTLFVGAVGRPDLPGRARESAAELYESIHAKLLTLPGTLEIYPAHFSGSMCGAGMSGKPSSTIDFERRFNPMLSLDRDAFVEALADVPPKPADMQANIRDNLGVVSEEGR